MPQSAKSRSLYEVDNATVVTLGGGARMEEILIYANLCLLIRNFGKIHGF
jgi:hypothetical protein